MNKFWILFNTTEIAAPKIFQDWLDKHPQIADQINLMVVGQTEGNRADIIGGKGKDILFVGENKVDTDADTSFNSGHAYNNFAQLRDDYPNYPKYLFLIDTHKKTKVPNPNGRGYHYEEPFSKDLIARMMSLAVIVGHAVPYYMKAERYGKKIWDLLNKPIKEVDCGIRYLERSVGNAWERGMQAIKGITPFDSASVAKKYKSPRELIWDGTGYDKETGEFKWLPDWIDLDGIFPPNADNENSAKHKAFLKFLDEGI